MAWVKPIHLKEIVADYIGLESPKSQDAFGIEIELEGRKLYPPLSHEDFWDYWRNVSDGSLRTNKPGDEAVEMRFRYPFDMGSTAKAVKTLSDYMTSKGVTVYDSPRASVHVHVNCCSESLRTLYNFITLALIFDELFVSQAGSHRIGNNFCLRAKDAQGQVVDLVRSINRYGNLRGIQRENRYSSVNIASIYKFGTIEFRALECTVDYKRLMGWVKTLQALKEAARTKFKDPREIIQQMSLRGPERFMMDVLGFTLSIPYLKVPNRVTMIFNGARLVQEFAFSSTWEEATVPAKKHRKINKILSGEDVGEAISTEEEFFPGLAWNDPMPQPAPPMPIPQPGNTIHLNIPLDLVTAPNFTLAQWQANFGAGGGGGTTQ